MSKFGTSPLNSVAFVITPSLVASPAMGRFLASTRHTPNSAFFRAARKQRVITTQTTPETTSPADNELLIAVDTYFDNFTYTGSHADAEYQLNLHTASDNNEEAQYFRDADPTPDADHTVNEGTLDQLFPEFDNSDIDALEFTLRKEAHFQSLR